MLRHEAVTPLTYTCQPAAVLVCTLYSTGRFPHSQMIMAAGRMFLLKNMMEPSIRQE
jgi:hypothetical protein